MATPLQTAAVNTERGSELASSLAAEQRGGGGAAAGGEQVVLSTPLCCCCCCLLYLDLLHTALLYPARPDKQTDCAARLDSVQWTRHTHIYGVSNQLSVEEMNLSTIFCRVDIPPRW